MAGKIIWYAVTIGCAVLFYAIGIYARKIDKPMWFWSGVEVDPSEITDVKAYNKANGRMWRLYSLWYLAAGLAEIWNSALALVFLILGCTVGIFGLVAAYRSIEKRYKRPKEEGRR